MCRHEVFESLHENRVLNLCELVECSHSVLIHLVCSVVLAYELVMLSDIVGSDGSVVAFLLCFDDIVNLVGDACDFSCELAVLSLACTSLERLCDIGVEGIDGILKCTELCKVVLSLCRLVFLRNVGICLLPVALQGLRFLNLSAMHCLISDSIGLQGTDST